MSMVTVAMVAPPITPTPAAIPPPRHVSLFEFFASTPPQTSPKSCWFSPNNGRAHTSRGREASVDGGHEVLGVDAGCLVTVRDLGVKANGLGVVLGGLVAIAPSLVGTAPEGVGHGQLAFEADGLGAVLDGLVKF